MEELANYIVERLLALGEEEGMIPARTIQNYVNEVCHGVSPKELYAIVVSKLEDTGRLEPVQSEKGEVSAYRYIP